MSRYGNPSDAPIAKQVRTFLAQDRGLRAVESPRLFAQETAAAITACLAEKESGYLQPGAGLCEVAAQWLHGWGLSRLASSDRSALRLLMEHPREIRHKILDYVCQHYPVGLRGPVEVALQGAGEFANLLLDVLNQTAISAARRAPPTWRSWGTVRPVSRWGDVTAVYAERLGTLPEVPPGEVPPGGVPPAVDIPAGRGTLTMKQYGQKVRLGHSQVLGWAAAGESWRIANPPTLLAQAAVETEDAAVYGLLAANSGYGPAMLDDKALFHVDHANLLDAAGLDVTTLGAAAKALAAQTTTGGKALHLKGRHLVSGVGLAPTAAQILRTLDSASLGADDRIVLTIAPQMDALHGGLGWILAADPAAYPGLVVGFLEGEEAPRLRDRTLFDTGDFEWACSHIFAAGFPCWKGLVLSRPAA